MKTCMLALLFVAIGCAPIETRTYSVDVRNTSTHPVTVWLTKNGPVDEPGWRSPEQIARKSLQPDDMVPGLVVPPGRTAYTGQMSGQFSARTDAILRVYLGQLSFEQILGRNGPKPDRIDVKLKPGENRLTIVDLGPGIKVTETEQPE